MPRFEVYRSGLIRREWRWRLVAGNGEIIASGEGYRERRACLVGIDRVRGLAPGAAIREATR